MITQQEAELQARLYVQLYVNDCGCDNAEDVGNALLKMLSVTAVSIMATQGKEAAIAMLMGTARFIGKQPDTWQKSTIQ